MEILIFATLLVIVIFVFLLKAKSIKDNNDRIYEGEKEYNGDDLYKDGKAQVGKK